MGASAGDALTSTSNSVIIGRAAGTAINSADANGVVLLGAYAGTALTNGQYNTAIGSNTLASEDDGDFNTAIGYNALTSQTGRSGEVGNTAVGYQVGKKTLRDKEKNRSNEKIAAMRERAAARKANGKTKDK